MTMSRLTTAIVLGTLALTALPGAAMAATAYASDKISVFEQPRSRANEIVGLLQPGEEVTIDRCTPTGNWCRVLTGGAPGWVPASYLIGSAAKVDATPLRSLTAPSDDQLRDLGHTRPDFF